MKTYEVLILVTLFSAESAIAADGQPDLTVAPAKGGYCMNSNPARLSITVENSGSVISSPTLLKIESSLNGQPNVVTLIELESLPDGGARTFDVLIPDGGGAGNRAFSIHIDPYEFVSESNERNNYDVGNCP